MNLKNYGRNKMLLKEYFMKLNGTQKGHISDLHPAKAFMPVEGKSKELISISKDLKTYKGKKVPKGKYEVRSARGKFASLERIHDMVDGGTIYDLVPISDINKVAKKLKWGKDGFDEANKMSMSYKLNNRDKHDVEKMWFTAVKDKSKKPSDIKDYISKKLKINYFEVSVYIDREILGESVNEGLPNPEVSLSKSQLKGMIRRAKRAGAKGYDIILSLSRDLSVTSDEMVSTLEKHRLIGMTEGLINDLRMALVKWESSEYPNDKVRWNDYHRDIKQLVDKHNQKEHVREVASPLIDTLNHAKLDVDELISVSAGDEATHAYNNPKRSRKLLMAIRKLLGKVN